MHPSVKINRLSGYCSRTRRTASKWSPLYQWKAKPSIIALVLAVTQVLAQFSHYVLPGAKRIAATCYTDKLETVAFVNPDGTFAVVLLNRTEQCMPVTLRIKGSLVACEIEANSMTTIVCAAKGAAID